MQAEITQLAERLGPGEEVVEAVGGGNHRLVGEAALALEAVQADVVAGVAAFDDQLGQGVGVVQADVQPLPGQRVHHVGGVADQREAFADVALGVLALDGEAGPRHNTGELAQALGEGGFNGVLERVVGELFAGFGGFVAVVPHQRGALAGQRQHGNRPFGGKTLPANILLGQLGLDVNDHRPLVVVVAGHANAR